jgi:hypothetical protein
MNRSDLPVSVQDLANYWCRTQGIHYRDLAEHPQIDDVILLIKFIGEYQKEFKAKQRVEVYIYWDWCYNKKQALKNKHLKNILSIGNRLEHIRNQKAKVKAQTRQRIKALRRTIPA